MHTHALCINGQYIIIMCIFFVSTVEFVLCVLGRGEGVCGDGVGSEKGGKMRRRLRDLIIQRIDHPSDDVSQQQ